MLNQRPAPTTYGAYQARSIATRLDHLNDYLTQPGTPSDTVAVLADVFDPEHGALAAFANLAATASRFAQDQATRGLLPPEVWLALGRAANELHDIGLDLEEHLDTLTASAAPGPSAGETARPPAPAPLVVRRHR
ncbi:hypothetical protein [Streptomyces sp. CC208A]|uniref:hypothetical protein n=1 Tax=Streptomyces sp. CC208A TaxID=3044573 RepID=UPI0024A96EFC|nr:hypothetical protein [Streptomyces sp. CC208A]